MFCIRDHHCWTMLLVYFNHRHSVRYNQKQIRNKKSDVVGRQHAIYVMNKRSPFAVPTSAAILKRSYRLKILVHLCQFLNATFYVHSKFNKNGFLCLSVAPTQTGSVRVKTGLA